LPHITTRREQPRLKYSPADPEAPGKWGHDLFGQQIQGGNLAFRLQMDRGPSAAEAKIAARNGGRGGSSSGGGGAGGGQDLMDASFDLLGRRPQQQQRQQQAAAREPRATRTADAEMQDVKPRASKPISILGSSGKTWVLVSNLVAGTTAEDVKVRCSGRALLSDAHLTDGPPCSCRRPLTSLAPSSRPRTRLRPGAPSRSVDR
jgi:hypothetical protein